MRLSALSVSNYRSIVDTGKIRIEPLQTFVGENNTGKSNILRAISCFLSVGTGGVKCSDLSNHEQPMIIEVEFTELTEYERHNLKRYLLGDKLIIRKELRITEDRKSGKEQIEAIYHGYLAEPKDWQLSIEKIKEEKGNKPNWKEIAEEYGILEYVIKEDGKVDKKSYESGIGKVIIERDNIEFDEPKLADGKAMGFQQNLLRFLPDFYLLPAITDYSDEIDKRSSSTVFRKLMGDLSDRIIKADPRYHEIESALNTLQNLLNPSSTPTTENASEEVTRLSVLSTIEGALCGVIARLMPTVEQVQLEVAIEEPELYIHPQSQRLIYRVLKEFVFENDENGTVQDQVIYSTHSPAFVDIAAYDQVGMVVKEDVTSGTKVNQCEQGVLGCLEELKGFKLLNSFDLKHNEMFFSRHNILVEGEQDEIAIVATGRKLGLFKEFPEEIGYSIIVTGNKEQIPKFQKILNAFNTSYSVWLELDGKPDTEGKNKEVIDLANTNTIAKMSKRMEEEAGMDKHFSNTFSCKKHFGNPDNITHELEELVKKVFHVN
ncbi:MAG: hypothetical protein SCARUB_00856 [Candidatus Scalindua rubra]|uniref:Uncharacterized protein n=1 Tax=Candidatus Scalindua rubra TaxID=1872076 RepID=A0A1E3XEC9_9BACT|nr:MAG: hypothetical protein SCARUB_00856 [Candidatus Scalindua rubra]